ncbi:HPP-domain-containing protein [Microthyrium microscopicum]|uniref:HPP-domain-containing protein n=1 Tax=Microthyrium microscopicum TaxID=703497 RepID=A0A6A6U5P9_9PEZI|nr:HPP-domain-containing protein [Microthyrium microscopicum]
MSFFSKLPAAENIHFDIDQYLNDFIPPSPLPLLPPTISRFFGHRKSPKADVGNILVSFWVLIGTFCGLLCISAVFKYDPWIQEHHPPILIASFGAAAVLEYNSIASPLAQPRNAILGHSLSAIIGVAIAKAFQSYGNSSQSLEWIVAPFACAVASTVMTMTNTIHPPGGATAILAVADPTIIALGWIFVPLVLLSCIMMIAVAIILNNIQRRYPLWWWTPHETGRAWKSWVSNGRNKAPDVEKYLAHSRSLAGSEAGLEILAQTTLEEAIVVSVDGVLNIPHSMELEDQERALLEKLVCRLQSLRHPRQNSDSTADKSWATPP